MMLQQIDRKKKLFIYLFFLFLLTTINNLSLNNFEYLKLAVKSVRQNWSVVDAWSILECYFHAIVTDLN